MTGTRDAAIDRDSVPVARAWQRKAGDIRPSDTSSAAMELPQVFGAVTGCFGLARFWNLIEQRRQILIARLREKAAAVNPVVKFEISDFGCAEVARDHRDNRHAPFSQRRVFAPAAGAFQPVIRYDNQRLRRPLQSSVDHPPPVIQRTNLQPIQPDSAIIANQRMRQREGVPAVNIVIRKGTPGCR